jgi:hypothetical protein
MALASILVRLGLDASGYQTGLKRAESAASKFGSFVKSRLAATFTVAAFTAAARAAVQWGDKLRDTSDDLKVSARTLQGWEFAANGTRATLDDVIRGFEYLSKLNPDLAPAQVLEKMNKLADAFKRGELSLGELQKNFGRGAAILAGVFNKGLTESAESAERLNLILSDQQVDALARVSDAWDRATLSAKAYFAQTLVNMANPEVWSRFFRVMGKAIMQSGGNPTTFGTFYGNAIAEERMRAFADNQLQGPPVPTGYKWPNRETPQTPEAEAPLAWRLTSPNANALQQVGAFSGAVPTLLAEAKKQTKHLAKIEKNTDPEAEE